MCKDTILSYVCKCVGYTGTNCEFGALIYILYLSFIYIYIIIIMYNFIVLIIAK